MRFFIIFIMVIFSLGCSNKHSANSFDTTNCFNYCNNECNYENNTGFGGNFYQKKDNIDLLQKQSIKLLQNKNEILSPGDVININIMNHKVLSKDYIIKSNGYIYLPWIKPIEVKGLSIDELSEKLKNNYINTKIFNEDGFYIIITVKKYAPISIKVNGEVFKPGLIVINKNKPEFNQYQNLDISYVEDKMLTLAIKLAGGIKPTANVENVRLIRYGIEYHLNLNGVLDDGEFHDIPLVSGDEIYIGSSFCVDKDLIRLSRITPVGVKLFLSNVTIPANNNNLSNINKDTREFPYGSRFMDAVFNSNCMGGTEASNSNRSFLLITSLNNDDELVALKISAYDLIKHKNSIHYNPYLMNGDKVTCYDSDMTNYAAIIKLLADTLTPINILHGLIGW